MSARSTSSRSTSSFSTSVRSRSNGPWKTSRSRSMVATRIWATRLRGGSDAHRAARVVHDGVRDRVGLLGALMQHLFQRFLVRAKLLVALADRRQVVDDGLCHGGLERPVALAVELALDLLGLDAANHAQDRDEVRDAGLVRRAADVAAGIRDGALDLLLDRLRIVEHEHAPGRARAGRRHL